MNLTAQHRLPGQSDAWIGRNGDDETHDRVELHMASKVLPPDRPELMGTAAWVYSIQSAWTLVLRACCELSILM